MCLSKRAGLVYVALAFCIGFLPGCASKRPAGDEAQPELEYIPIKKIAILPIQNPRVFTLDRSAISPLIFFGAMGIAVSSSIHESKKEGFRLKMQEYNVPLGIDLMQSLEQGLNAEKYEVVVLREQDMGYANPKDFDYGKIITDADALAHIIITETGVSSSLRKPNYKPRLNVDVKIISSKDQTKIDDWTVEYGADASKLNDGSFPSDPKFAWSDYDVVMQKIPEVIEGLQQGAKLLGGHIAKTVRERKL